VCKLDEEYTECCVDDQSCVIDDSDEESKMKVCEDNKAVCGGRSDCNPDDGFFCVGNKVCCMDKEEVPCDPSGSTSRVCCDPTIYKCEMEDGQYDCFDKEETPAGRRRMLLGRGGGGGGGGSGGGGGASAATASSLSSTVAPPVPAWARPGARGDSPALQGKRRREQERRPWRTAEGRALRRARQLANRRGVTLAEETLAAAFLRQVGVAPAVPSLALRPPVVVRTYEDVVVEGGEAAAAAAEARRRTRRQ
jgi:hypothetical protein